MNGRSELLSICDGHMKIIICLQFVLKPTLRMKVKGANCILPHVEQIVYVSRPDIQCEGVAMLGAMGVAMLGARVWLCWEFPGKDWCTKL